MSEANLLALEQPLIDRLIDRLPVQWQGVNLLVGSLADVIGRQDLAELCPAVLVTPGTSTALDADGDPDAGDGVTAEEQQWLVVALVQFVRGTQPLTYASAGQLMAQVYRALHGWRPGPEYRPLKYEGQDAPAPAEKGVMQFAASFSVLRAFDPDEFNP